MDELLEALKVAVALKAAARLAQPGYREVFDYAVQVGGVEVTPETETALLRMFTYAVCVGEQAGKDDKRQK